MEVFLTMIMLWPCNFAPSGWAFCDGSILSIAQNAAIFSLLGTTYGGNGTTNFALPDLRGRIPVGAGSGPSLSPYVLGQVGGAQSVSILLNNMPAHNHTVSITIAASNAKATVSAPVAGTNTLAAIYDTIDDIAIAGYNNGTPNVPLNAGPGTSGNTGLTGSGTPISVLQPYLAVNYCIALVGIFPSRN
jgi:microcystin-dependent protein